MHQNNCEQNSKNLTEDREREEIQITLTGEQKAKFQVWTHILWFFLSVISTKKNALQIHAGIIMRMTSTIQKSVLTSPID